jgi:hypothetical protein
LWIKEAVLWRGEKLSDWPLRYPQNKRIVFFVVGPFYWVKKDIHIPTALVIVVVLFIKNKSLY